MISKYIYVSAIPIFEFTCENCSRVAAQKRLLIESDDKLSVKHLCRDCLKAETTWEPGVRKEISYL